MHSSEPRLDQPRQDQSRRLPLRAPQRPQETRPARRTLVHAGRDCSRPERVRQLVQRLCERRRPCRGTGGRRSRDRHARRSRIECGGGGGSWRRSRCRSVEEICALCEPVRGRRTRPPWLRIDLESKGQTKSLKSRFFHSLSLPLPVPSFTHVVVLSSLLYATLLFPASPTRTDVK